RVELQCVHVHTLRAPQQAPARPYRGVAQRRAAGLGVRRTDPLTGRRHYLRETIPASTRAEDEAQKALRRLANQVDERRNPRTSATVNQLLDRHSNSLSWKRTPSSTTATWPRSTSGH
ncbi:MAG TPA: hypothetical protein VIY28_13425, partial [Pseudonocardiaceae bacterium]